MTTRQYSSRSQQTTLTGTITSGATSMTVVSGTTLLGGVTIPSGRTFTLVIDPDTALEEIVDATAVATNTFTITRAIDGSSAQEHSAGAVVRHMAIGRDFRDANLHAEASAYYNDGSGTGHTMHGIGSGEGDVVGTAKTQTLTNKTLTSPTISNPTFTGTPSAEASIVFEGTTADAYETTLTVVDPTQDNTITLPNTTGNVVIDSATQTLTNKTLTSPVISGTPVITGLSSAGMISSSATPKDYVDSILGSATAAATSAASAATSAASAATSASSASTSASSALTSANSASTSATAAATSAASAATSATAASTSATSAAASASAASTSASSAATSASSASTSASSALTSANSASTSASSALTSANSASTSATAAATSATSAAASATAAATSATSAAASATAAATSATSAAASATSAANSASAAATSATSAAASATAAATSETNAAASATAAATSASSASTSASSALTSANSASTSASSALTSANSAATSATSAAASYDQFDDRYLGDKSSDPTVDNDGNPLLTGALYFNTVVGAMKVYDGSAWDLVAPDTSNFIDKSILAGKGSLISASGASTPVNLTAPSTNGYILTYDSATTSGLAWVAPNPGDITAVTAGDGLTGGGTSGDVTLAVSSDVLRTTGGQVISANTSANALEIRQTGAGNALVVEDSTNPDASPFVIDADGRTLIGHTTAGTVVVNAGLQVSGTGGTSYISQTRFSADANGPGLLFSKSRGSSYSVRGAVTSADTLGQLSFIGDDGTSYVQGANVFGYVDGTVSTGVVPGRLVFSTASSAGAMTERMRIDSAGGVGIGGTAGVSTSLRIVKNITGAASVFGLVNDGIVQADATSEAFGIYSALRTVNSTFTLGTLYHYGATQGTFGASSTVTNQIGYLAGALTSATNNFGFYGNLAAGSGRWNFYAFGTAANYFAGRVGIGATLTSGAMAQVANTTAADIGLIVKGAASQTGDLLQIQNSAGTVLSRFTSAGWMGIGISPSYPLQVSATSVGSTVWVNVNNTDTTAGSAAGYFASNGAVNNVLYSSSNGGGGTLGTTTNHPLFIITNNTERMRIDASGNVGIGKSPSYKLDVNGTVNATALYVNGAPLSSGVSVATLEEVEQQVIMGALL